MALDPEDRSMTTPPERATRSRAKGPASRVHDAERVERMLDRAQRRDPARRGEALELVALQLADAVLGGDRAAGRGDEIVDQPGDRRALALVEVGAARGPARTWKWTLPSPRWPKALAMAPGKARSTSPSATAMKRGMASTGTEMSCASVGPSARSASEMVSRMFQKASACASFAAITASAIRPCSSASPSRRFDLAGESAVARSALVASISTCQRMRRRQAARGCRGCAEHEVERIAGTSSNPSTRAGPRFEEAQQVERLVRAVGPGPGDARARRPRGPAAARRR